jgi:hypothetical protein
MPKPYSLHNSGQLHWRKRVPLGQRSSLRIWRLETCAARRRKREHPPIEMRNEDITPFPFIPLVGGKRPIAVSTYASGATCASPPNRSDTFEPVGEQTSKQAGKQKTRGRKGTSIFESPRRETFHDFQFQHIHYMVGFRDGQWSRHVPRCGCFCKRPWFPQQTGIGFLARVFGGNICPNPTPFSLRCEN